MLHVDKMASMLPKVFMEEKPVNIFFDNLFGISYVILSDFFWYFI